MEELMAKKKSKAPVVEKVKQPRKDPRIEEIYEEEVTFTCPVRGIVKQKVKIKRYKPSAESTPSKGVLLPQGELATQLEEKDDGMAIYNDGEDLGLSGEETIH